MKNYAIGLLSLVLALVLGLEASARFRRDSGPKLAHMVFFGLKDKAPETRQRFLASCDRLLRGHEGTVSYSVGFRADDVDEPVSVKDFDIALHLVFASKEAKLNYLKDPRHDQFVEENRELFDKVWVYDSYLQSE